jgi:hypothetical protein
MIRLTIVLLVSGLIVQISNAVACVCTGIPPLAEAVEESDAVFRGRVITIEPNDFWPEDLDRVTFDVKACWKGTFQDTLALRTFNDEVSCGFPFSVGEEYLVFALESGGLITSNCTRTKHILEAEEDLVGLGVPKAVPVLPSSWGILKQRWFQPSNP